MDSAIENTDFAQVVFGKAGSFPNSRAEILSPQGTQDTFLFPFPNPDSYVYGLSQ